MTTLDTGGAHAWLAAFARAGTAAADELGELDRQCGDGDFGTTLRATLDRLLASLEARPPASVADVFSAASRAFMDAGGTSGPLFGVWFRALSRAAATDAGAITLAELAAGVQAGNEAVERVGGAQPGDKTMVDALVPAGAALADAAAAGAGLSEALVAAARAARAAADGTAELAARRGRATYVGAAAHGVVDPGAAAVALIFEAAEETVGETDGTQRRERGGAASRP